MFALLETLFSVFMLFAIPSFFLYGLTLIGLLLIDVANRHKDCDNHTLYQIARGVFNRRYGDQAHRVHAGCAAMATTFMVVTMWVNGFDGTAMICLVVGAISVAVIFIAEHALQCNLRKQVV